MTRDDIIRMAKEAGLTLSSFCRWSAYSDDLERFATLVAAAEREACAKVCFDMAKRHDDIRSAALEMASEYIRARGEI